MNLAKFLSGSLMLAFAPLAAPAEVSYSYVDLGYVETDIDGLPSADGFGVRGSAAFSENWFVFGEYANQDLAGIDIDQFAVGLGGRYVLTEEMDFVGRVGYVDAEAAIGGFAASVDGFLVSAGLRGQIGDGFELDGRVDYVDLGDEGGDDAAIAIAGRYFFTEQFALGAEYSSSDDSNAIFAGFRWSF